MLLHPAFCVCGEGQGVILAGARIGHRLRLTEETNQTGFLGIVLSGVREARTKMKATHVDVVVVAFRYRGASPLASPNVTTHM